MQTQTVRSRWWFLLPIFLNIMGGFIAYFVLRHDDPAKAKNCLLLGIVLLAVMIASTAIGTLFSEAPLGELDV